MSGKSIIASAIAIGPAIVVGRMVGRKLGKLSYVIAKSSAKAAGETEMASQYIARSAHNFTKVVATVGVGVLTYNTITGLFR